jgi:class 3 adenylate cyclase/tetratricopeptide (TPR) repeat protein
MISNCRFCSGAVPEGARFCPSCGAKAGADGGEAIRKPVTILVSDVVGSTAVAERMDPESLGQLMMTYFEAMNEILRRHGGVVEKYMGDAVLAVFGLPSAHEDDAVRACRAASEMRVALRKLNQRLQATWGVALETRTGVNTGEVVAAAPTRDQTLPLGDPVNVAARLESAAPPGEIYIGQSTWRLVRHAVEAEPLEPLALKGKAQAVRAWRLVDMMPVSALRPPQPIGAPFVPRDAPLAALNEAFDATVRDRSCRLATVIGDPGVGKSRLALEFLTGVEGRAGVLQARCISYGEGITFWPLGEILKQAAGIGEQHGPGQATAALEGILAGRNDRARIVPPLASAIGWLETAFPIEDVFWGTRAALEHLARTRPLVVVIDDIHWAEQQFLNLLEHVARFCGGVSLLILCLARPDLIEACPEWATGVSYHTVVHLGPLSGEETAVLAGGILGASELPEDLLRSLTLAAEGNPLFVEQLIGLWLDRRVLVRSNGSWRLTADPSALEVPPSIRALLQSRLDRLTFEHRTLLERAAVIGQVFRRAGLLELADRPVEAVDARLEDLIARGFIDRHTETSAPEPSFRFHHVLLRDAAYEGALKGRRAALHERFGSWLRQSVGQRLTEYQDLIGFHFEQAYQYLSELGAPDDHASEIGRVAFDHLAAAGRRALAREDATAAVNLLSRAAALLPEGDQVRLGLLPDLGDALSAAGRDQEANRILRQVMDAASASGDQLLRARATVIWTHVQPYVDPTWRESDVHRHVSAILPILEAAGDDRAMAAALAALAAGRHGDGHYDGLEEMARRVIAHASRAGPNRWETNMRSWVCSLGWWGPTPVPEAIDRCRETLVWAEAAPGTDGCAGRVLRALGALEAMVGRFEEARECLARSAAIFDRLGSPPALSITQMCAGEVELLAGRADVADEILRASLPIAETNGVYGYLTTVSLAEAALMRGRIDEADQLTTASSILKANTNPNAAAWGSIRARVLGLLGRVEEAEAEAREAVAKIDGTGALVARGRTHASLAEVLREVGRHAEARAEFGRALALYEQKGDVVRAALVRDALALPQPTVTEVRRSLADTPTTP